MKSCLKHLFFVFFFLIQDFVFASYGYQSVKKVFNLGASRASDSGVDRACFIVDSYILRFCREGYYSESEIAKKYLASNCYGNYNLNLDDNSREIFLSIGIGQGKKIKSQNDLIQLTSQFCFNFKYYYFLDGVGMGMAFNTHLSNLEALEICKNLSSKESKSLCLFGFGRGLFFRQLPMKGFFESNDIDSESINDIKNGYDFASVYALNNPQGNSIGHLSALLLIDLKYMRQKIEEKFIERIQKCFVNSMGHHYLCAKSKLSESYFLLR